MDERVITVNMGQLEVSRQPGDVLTALGLGSCVAVCAYDPALGLAGMIHVVLPSSAISRSKEEGPAKFADVGVPHLVDEMEKQGAIRRRLRTAMLGGANVLSYAGEAKALDIGARNAAAVQEALEAQRISVRASEVGGKVSRTVRLWVADGIVIMKTLREGQVRVTVLGDENGSRASKRGLTRAPHRARPTARAGGG